MWYSKPLSSLFIFLAILGPPFYLLIYYLGIVFLCLYFPKGNSPQSSSPLKTSHVQLCLPCTGRKCPHIAQVTGQSSGACSATGPSLLHVGT